MLGINPRIALGRRGSQATPWTPSVHLDGTTFSTNQVLPGLAGGKDLATNASRAYMAASSGSNLVGGSLWAAIIKGTGATLVLGNTATPTNAVLVSVDGGAFAAVSNTGAGPYTYTLFSGASDAEHLIVFRIGTAWGTNKVYFDKTLGTCLSITGGADTYVEMCSQWVYAGVTDSLSIADGMTKANATNYTPDKTKQSIYSTVSNVSSARIRGQFASIQVACTGQEAAPDLYTAVYVSVDGAAPTKYTFSAPGIGGAIRRVTGLDSTAVHTYDVWTDYVKAQAMFAVSGDADHVDVGTKKRMHQFGDSITFGGGTAAVPGEVDLFRVAASMGFAATTAGISGQTINGLELALPTYLAALTVTSSDVAILAIGRNNVTGGIDAAEQTDYGDCIDLLVAKGYGKIICRGILPAGDHSNYWTTENAALAAVVTAKANPAVVFCDVSGCPTYSTQASDNTHPDAAGYAVIAAHVEPLYRTLLGL